MPHQTDGRSLVKLIEDPDHPGWEDVAFAYFRDGISLRTDRYRFTKYFREEEPRIELFDHENDANETVNIAGENQDIVDDLTKLWNMGNTGLFEK